MNQQQGPAPRGLGSLLFPHYFHYNGMNAHAAAPQSLVHSISSQMPHPSSFMPHMRGYK